MRLLSILKSCLLLAFSLVWLFACGPKKTYEWTRYGGNAFNNHYSPLALIDTNNVASLSVAWEYHSGDADEKTQIQTNPLIIDGVLYGVSPKLKLFALDAATGKELWNFNPVDTNTLEVKGRGYFSMNVCRGLSYFKGDDQDQRLFYSAGGYLHCIDALSGKPIKSFGTNGWIDLHNDLGRDLSQYYVAATTPGMVYKDMIIIGSRVAEDAAAAPGHIRAYDVHSGKLRWIFHTIPHPDEAGFESWDNKEAYQHIGGANAWSGFSLDEEKGILFAPIGSASYDFYGGKRTGDNLFANSVLALDAATGKRIWHFQTVHHDIWDRDLPTAPVVVNLQKDGKQIEAVAQVTKSGFVFLLERNTGKPVYPIVETAVPTQTELLGEKTSPTQPITTVIAPFARQTLLEKDLNRLVADTSFKDIQQRLASYKTGHLYNPPSKQGTVIFPGFDGGAEWGGPAVDPSTGIMYVNASEMPWILTMVDRKAKSDAKETNLDAGKRLYQTTCMPCHGPERKGGGNYPSLLDAKKKYNEEQLIGLVTAGKQMMPAMSQLAPSEKIAIASFILDLKDKQGKAFEAPARPVDPWLELPYTSTGYNKFLTKEGYPAVMPPWGTLTAIDLNTGKQVWKDTLGDYPELKAKGIHTGTENYGGAVVTAGGLLFIAATKDSKFRAYNKRTGKLLLELDLPAPGFATPAVYEKNGKQYIVIACGGGKLKSKTSDTYLAFSINKP